MSKKKKTYCTCHGRHVPSLKHHILPAATVLLLSAALTGCQNSADSAVQRSATETLAEETTEAVSVAALSPTGPEFPSLDITLPETEPAPEYLRNGVEHQVVAELQARLMELGFMDNDEPTDYYGNVTEQAIKTYQRQNDLPQDGIVGASTLTSIMSPDAKYYTVTKGESGDDIQRIQSRLYELGYLATADMVSGNFGDSTEAAVIKLQEVNGLTPDGAVGKQTVNLLYSEEIKPNTLAYGEKSEVVLACQNRLKALGYLTTTPDGTYGADTAVAIKQFQARNDLIVDGYLGPSTKLALDSDTAQPNGLTLGEEGENVQSVQKLLSSLGYLASANVTGYYGEVTQNAVKSFQSTNGLTVDGSVGMQTMAKLTGGDAKKASSNSSGGSSSGSSSSKVTGKGVSALLSIARSKLGRPYVWGAKGPGSFDCSGFVYWCLNQAGVRQSYLTSAGWRSVGKYTKITSFSNLRAGDIIVVKGHMGIAAGGGRVIDASSSNGKIVERSLSSWWSRNFVCGWRVF